MSLYDEKPKGKEDNKEDEKDSPYSSLSDVSSNLVDFKDSVIYLNEDITETSLVDLMIKIRCMLSNRNQDQNEDPINIVINSSGGDIYDMLGIIDYLESLSVKINTICRGKALSAAAILLACGTGTRMMSQRSTVMFHQASSFISGKMSDINAYVDNIKILENAVYDLLGSKTKKDANWWREQMKSDLFLSPEILVEYGVIDQII